MNYDDYMELFHEDEPCNAEYYCNVPLQGEERIKTKKELKEIK